MAAATAPFRGGDKATLFEGGLKAPCVMRWPGKIKPGTVSDEILCSLDFFASFCEAAGLEENLPRHDVESFLEKLAPAPDDTARHGKCSGKPERTWSGAENPGWPAAKALSKT